MSTSFAMSGRWVCVSCVLTVLGGCAQFQAARDEGHRKETIEQISRVDQHSSYPAMRRDSFEQVNLLELIDPEGQSVRDGYSKDWRLTVTDEVKGNIGFGQRYDLVLSWFGRQPDGDDWKRLRRNSVQDKIIAVSTSRCNVFKTYLRRQQVDVNFTLGSLTTAAGVLGAVLPGADASRSLAGAAGLFSGIRSEYNQSYYSNLAAHVIVQGIELRQNRLKKELVEARQGKSIAEYSMEAAINDAIVIDGNCSAVSGLIEAQDSIREVESPGMRMAARAMAGANALKEIQNTPSSKLVADGTLDKLLALAGSDVPSMLVTSTRTDLNGNPSRALANANSAAERIGAYIAQQGSQVVGEFEALQEKAKEGSRSELKSSEVRKTLEAAVNTSVLEPLTKLHGTKPAVLTACLQTLVEPTAVLGAAVAKMALTQADPDARITGQLALDKAHAEVAAAVAKVERVIEKAQTEIGARTKATLDALKAKAASDKGVKDLKLGDVTDAINKLGAPTSFGCGTETP
ncbi:hypothetical protein [Rhodoferax aquaticus]|uniref:Lipoprotein n=1 Tax=Rhodoferax aquaticus TaxID=2527691 RepID=A0A515EP52_9BURK|nr:hypothetical protein [Rhodoferax aquaticus]QDL54431.1 hypothetical protein EXZ61_09785 [Rhodoferax aquaticus]